MNNKNSSWTITFAKLGETNLKVHLSLALFLVWIFFEHSSELPNLSTKILLLMIFVGSLFLHESAHLLAAAALNLKVNETTLYPFGGDFKVVGERRPFQELALFSAGPIASLLVAAICLVTSDISLSVPLGQHIGLISRIYYINLLLGLINLVPCAPLDGARILSALLHSLKITGARQISTSISQFVAIIFCLGMLFTGNLLAMIVGAVILVKTVSDHLYSRFRNAAVGLKVSDIMIEASKLETFQHGMTVSQCVKAALRSFQPAFPVTYSDQLVGIIERQTLLELTTMHGSDSYISGHVTKEYSKLESTQPVEDVIDLINSSGIELFVVSHEDKFLGLVVKDRVLEFLVVQELHKRAVETQGFLDQEF